MTPDVIGFWMLAVLLVGSGLAVVLSKNLFHSVLWLAASLIGTAGIFLLLDAEFLASVQVLLYAGGVITVVVFAIVVTEKLVGERLSQVSRRLGAAGLVVALIVASVIAVIRQVPDSGPAPELTADLTKWIGLAVLTHDVLAFELLGVLLVAGLMAASYFARPED